MKKHQHKFMFTKKNVTKSGIPGALGMTYNANIAECKCGYWYYVTIPEGWVGKFADKVQKTN